MIDGAVVESVAKGVGMVEQFGKRDPSRKDVLCLRSIARELETVGALGMRANTRIMAAESLREVAVAPDIIRFDPDPAGLERCRNLATEKRCGPAAMAGLDQEIVVAGALRERDQFAGAVTRQRRLASDRGVHPQAPFGPEIRRVIAQRRAHLGGPAVGLFDFRALHAAHDDQSRTKPEQKIELAPRAI